MGCLLFSSIMDTQLLQPKYCLNHCRSVHNSKLSAMFPWAGHSLKVVRTQFKNNLADEQHWALYMKEFAQESL